MELVHLCLQKIKKQRINMSEDCMWFACSMVRYAGVWPANLIHEVGMVMGVIGFPIGLFLPF